MDFEELVREISEGWGEGQRVAYLEVIPPREARLVELPEGLHPTLSETLRRMGVTRLYVHQARALELLSEGHNVVIATGTASGKSLCYHIPVYQEILENPSSRALYIFPTKALAQDQLRSLEELHGGEVVSATYDGDTPLELRGWIRRQAQVVLTNPDMLHYGILPNHRLWGGFFRHLRYVVLDEAHVARGVFGSHVAQVLRRLRRTAEHYGSRPSFVFASATIANPEEHASRLCGLEVRAVEDDSSPRGRKVFALWNPPDILSREGGEVHRSSNLETAEILARLIRLGVRTIAFCRSRKAAELVYGYVMRLLGAEERGLAERVSPYRGGYLPGERREIERRLFSGELLAVTTTNALELGVDIGELEACLMNGYPGTIASTWQQAGRAGRRQGESLAVLVAADDPLDQYLVRHPEFLFGSPCEEAVIDLENRRILGDHLVCAAFEFPLREEDEEYFGPAMGEALEELVREGRLKKRGGRWYFAGAGSPAQDVNLRSASGKLISIVDRETGTLLGTVEEASCFFHVHPGAVYLHQGDSYLVEELDLERMVALVRAEELDFYTNPMDNTDVMVLGEEWTSAPGPRACSLHYGEVEVSVKVYAYQKRRLLTHEVLETLALDLPTRVLRTKALWYTLPLERLAPLEMDEYTLAGGLHALEHASIAMLPLFAMCDRWDIGGMSTAFHPDTGRATVFIYDAYPGGVGIAARGFRLAARHLRATREMVERCPCAEGCPSCIQSPKCGSGNEPLHKRAAVELLKLLEEDLDGE
ncbi:DEAD/DEAH box helicase [Candidatus Solincola tengchongensis]|uniref:DEAD/DEAH box helicase n=1 Tax=Candidatus Solincola tengchongensis TaxID=2900693 RepID=UPI00257A617A|nr:DEAD/DEAH box helicase [Candidatus Solincola tengchongensis]